MRLKFFYTIIIAYIVSWHAIMAQEKLIAITQIIDHPALNINRQGIEDVLKTDANIKIVFQNAQGQVNTSTQIANKFVNMNPDVMVGISTLSTQSLLSARKDRDIPIVFSAVTDPYTAKLVDQHAVNNKITGSTDYPPISVMVEYVNLLLQQPKNIGFIYNPSEINSTSLLNSLKSTIQDVNLVVVTANNSSMVASAVSSLIGKVDGIIVPMDNTVYSALNTLMQIADKNNIPVFSFVPDNVNIGALMCVGYDQYAVGESVGHKIMKILAGVKVKDIPVGPPKQYDVVLNKRVADKLSVTIPQNIINKVRIVN